MMLFEFQTPACVTEMYPNSLLSFYGLVIQADTFTLKKKIKWGMLLYNIVLVSAVQWSESATCIHISPPSWTSPSPHPTLLGHHRARSWAPCAIQQLPASYPFYTRYCEYINPHFPVHLSPLLHVHLSILHVCISIPALQTLTLQMKESICQWNNWKRLISKIYKQLTELNIKRLNNSINKWADLNRYFSKEGIQRAKRYTKRCSTLLNVREKRIKTTMRYHLTLLRIAIIKKSANNKLWREYGEKGTLPHRWWECKLV